MLSRIDQLIDQRKELQLQLDDANRSVSNINSGLQRAKHLNALCVTDAKDYENSTQKIINDGRHELSASWHAKRETKIAANKESLRIYEECIKPFEEECLSNQSKAAQLKDNILKLNAEIEKEKSRQDLRNYEALHESAKHVLSEFAKANTGSDALSSAMANLQVSVNAIIRSKAASLSTEDKKQETVSTSIAGMFGITSADPVSLAPTTASSTLSLSSVSLASTTRTSHIH